MSRFGGTSDVGLWQQLPLDIFLLVLQFLPVHDILNLEQVCRCWGEAIRQYVDVSQLVALEGRQHLSKQGSKHVLGPNVLYGWHMEPSQYWMSRRQRSLHETSCLARIQHASYIGGARVQVTCTRQPLARAANSAKLAFLRMQSLQEAAVATFLASLSAEVAQDRQRAVVHVRAGNFPCLPDSFGLGVCTHCARCHPFKCMVGPWVCRTCDRLDSLVSPAPAPASAPS
eukprot:jgi/Botrbrau1/1464/Bobra.178_3s0021.1